MKINRVAYLIKHSKVLKTLYVFFGSLVMRILGFFVSKDEHLILFVANVGKSFSGSPYSIFRFIKDDPKYNEYRCVWALNHPEQIQEEHVETIKFDTIHYFLTALKAKYWVTDVNIERSLRFKSKKTIYLNTWHGVALKKIGNDDANSGRYDYSTIDYLCVSGSYDKKVFKSALNATQNSFLECGMPRNDSLFGVTEKQKWMLRSKLGIPKEKKVILYAPTWRDSTNNGKSFDLKVPVHFLKWRDVLGEQYMVLFRAHDRTTKVMDISFDDFVIDCSKYEPLNDLLIVSDILITDYSSIVFDYSILAKPFICFGYDYDQYVEERGTYFDAAQVYPQGMFKSEDEVLEQILSMDYEEECKKTRTLNSMFMEYSKGKATETCVHALLGC